MLTNASQNNLTWLKYLKQHIKPNPNTLWGKPRFRVESKMAAIIKPVIYVVFLNHYHFRTKHRRTNAKIFNLQKCRQMFFNIFLLIGVM